MIKLEKITAEYFNQYAQQVTPKAEWKYLSKERKEEWVLEVAERYKHCLQALKKELARPPLVSTGQAAFEKGFICGEDQENKRITYKLDLLEKSLDEQVENILYEDS